MICERGEHDKVMMISYFFEFSNLIYTNRPTEAYMR